MSILNSDRSTLNVFCDASIIKNSIGITIGCAGCTLTLLDEEGRLNKWYDVNKVIYDTTNNNSEISAILISILEILKHKDKFSTINLFSDSKICIMGLREWIFNWINCVKNGVMISSTGQPVANQEVFIHIINTILSNDIRVNLYHQKGHVTGSQASIENAREVFYKSNGVLLGFQDVKTISDFNNYVDIMTKNVLNSLGDQDRTSLIDPIVFDIQKMNIGKYRGLINHN